MNCGSLKYKGKYFHFCDLQLVKDMCPHPQLPYAKFLEVYNAQWRKDDDGKWISSTVNLLLKEGK